MTVSELPRFSTVLARFGHTVPFSPELARMLGSRNAALFLQQLLWRTPQAADPEGWVFKSADEWEDETTLSYKEQRLARKALGPTGLWLLDERHDRLAHRIYFKVDLERLDELAAAWLTAHPPKRRRAPDQKEVRELPKKRGGAPDPRSVREMPSGQFGKCPPVSSVLPGEDVQEKTTGEVAVPPAPGGAGDVQAELLGASPEAGAETPTDSAVARPAPGHPAVRIFVDRWRAVPAHQGKSPTVDAKRVGILTRIYKKLEDKATGEYERILTGFFRSSDRFIVENGHSPEVLQMRLDALRVNGNGHAGREAAAPEAPSGRQSKRINDKFVGAVTGRVSL